MVRMLLVVSVAVALVSTAVGPAANGPSLRPTGFAPLIVAGQGFAPGEKVTVTVYGGARHALEVVAGTTGGFKARFSFVQPRCTAWLLRALGSHSGPVAYRHPLGQCRPPVAAGSAPPARGTGVTGVVRRGPITPVCTVEVPCNGPAAMVEVDLVQDCSVVSRVTTGADGRFYVLAVPSDYVVRAAGRRLLPRRARVRAGRFVEVDFLIDTGIR